MRGPFIIIIIALLALAVFYFSRFIFRFIKLYTKIELSNRWKVIIVCFLIVSSVPLINMYSIFTNIYMHLLIVSLLYEGIYLLLKKNKIYKFLFTTGILTVATVGLIMCYGYYNMNNVVLTKYSITNEKIDKLKVLQITDLHMSNSVTVKELKKYASDMSKLDADIVVLTGDIFDEQTPLKDMIAACEILGTIKNKSGIYFVYGNHDGNHYSKKKKFTTEDIVNNLTANGIFVLADETMNLNGVSIIGRIDVSSSRYDIKRKEMTELITTANMDNYIIVLDHQPVELEENAKLGVNLQLSGHTHGGQYWPSGPLEALLSRRLMYGRRNIGNFTAITSSGISGWGAPLKTGAPSEYVLITITNK